MTPTEMRDTPTEEEMREAVARAYEQGCIDTHKAIQAEPELALMSIEHTEFGEAAGDYAHSVALRSGGKGWRLVPVEPTEEMIAAGSEALADIARSAMDHAVLFAGNSDESYRAMIAAAPSPSTHGEG